MMSVDSQDAHRGVGLSARLQEATGQSVVKCYQCGKCSAGCPLASEMDFPPSQVLRMLQLEQAELEEKVLGSLSIWLCLTCETCMARCPKEVDLPRIMEFLREEALNRNVVHPKARDILAFHRAFLDGIKYTGRLYEVGLIAGYKVRTGHLFQDLLVAPKLLARGKLHVVPKTVAGRSQVSSLFHRAMGKKESPTEKKEGRG